MLVHTDLDVHASLEDVYAEIQHVLGHLNTYACRSTGVSSAIDSCVKSASLGLHSLQSVLEAEGPSAAGPRSSPAVPLRNAGPHKILKAVPEASGSWQVRGLHKSRGATLIPDFDDVTFDNILSSESHPGLWGVHDYANIPLTPRFLSLGCEGFTNRAATAARAGPLDDGDQAPRDGTGVTKELGESWWHIRCMGSEHRSSTNTIFLHPRRPCKLAWDMCTLGLIVMLIFVVPLELSFFTYSQEESLVLDCFNYIVDGFFWADIVLNFFTAFYSTGVAGEVLVNDIKGMSEHYLRDGFVLDLLASFPYAVCLTFAGLSNSVAEDSSKSSNLLKGLRVAKALRVLKILRVVKLGKLTQRLEEISSTTHALMAALQLTKLTFALLLMWHVSACVFVFLGTELDASDVARGWLEAQGLEDAPGYTKYVTSLYFVITTGTTVGYGDVAPTSVVGQGVASGALILGVCYMSQFMTHASNIIGSLRHHDREKAQSKRQALLFMSAKKVGRDLQLKILRYIEYLYDKKTMIELDDRIMNRLSESLQKELAMAVMGNVLNRFPLFTDYDPHFIMALSSSGTTRRAAVGDVVIQEDTPAREMFWLLSGEATVERKGLYITTLRPYDWFGELALFLPRVVRAATVRCEAHCEFFVLHYDQFQEQMQSFPLMKPGYRKLVLQLQDGNLNDLRIVCAHCGSHEHVTRDCIVSHWRHGLHTP